MASVVKGGGKMSQHVAKHVNRHAEISALKAYRRRMEKVDRQKEYRKEITKINEKASEKKARKRGETSGAGMLRERRELKHSEVVFQTNHLLFVDKPAGIPSQPDISGAIDIIELAKSYVKKSRQKQGDVYLANLHRLDRSASGLLCFARTSKAAKRMMKMFKNHEIEKEYLTLVSGELTGNGVTKGGSTSYERYWQSQERRGSSRYQKMFPDAASERMYTPAKLATKLDGDLEWAALSHAVSLEGSTKDVNTLVAVRMKGGRKHQIRRHFAQLGHPLINDVLYGARSDVRLRKRGALQYDRIMLHASRMYFKNPVLPQSDAVAKKTAKNWHHSSGKPKPLLSTEEYIDVACKPPSIWRKIFTELYIPELVGTNSYFDMAMEASSRDPDDVSMGYLMGLAELALKDER